MIRQNVHKTAPASLVEAGAVYVCGYLPEDPDYYDDEEEEAFASKEAGVPTAFAVGGLYPNPFNPVMRVVFDLPERSEVRVAVYDLLGRQVLVVPAQTLEAGFGRHIAIEGSHLASGTYLYRLTATAGGIFHVATGQMVLIR